MTTESDSGIKPPQPKRKISRLNIAPDTKRYYFSADTQEAIGLFQSSSDQREREKLYVSRILPAFQQLVENLICIYKFVSLYDSQEDLQNDCITFLYETLHKFDPGRGTKAFSYFNVVAKRWLIVRSKKRAYNIKRMVSLDAVDVYGNDNMDKLNTHEYQIAPHLDFTVASHDDEAIAHQYSQQLMLLFGHIRDRLTNENEIKCIDSIVTLFEQREDLPMHNKRAVFTYIREMSGLSPKQLTLAISVIKRYYTNMKDDDEFG